MEGVKEVSGKEALDAGGAEGEEVGGGEGELLGLLGLLGLLEVEVGVGVGGEKVGSSLLKQRVGHAEGLLANDRLDADEEGEVEEFVAGIARAVGGEG